MTTRRYLDVFFCLALALAVGCGQSEEKAKGEAAKKLEEAGKKMEEAGKKVEEAGKDMERAMKEGGEGFGEAMKAMGDALSGGTGKSVEPVDFRELKALLPESLPGMKRTNATGEKTAAMGFKVSKAEGRYTNDQGASIDITISDTGTLSGFTAMAAYGWALAEMDRETESGYEKTTKIGGYKGYEKYDNQSKNGEINVLVGQRFVVEIDGNDVGMDVIKGALGKIDLAKLDAKKTQGVQP